jgi:hypothetical protein
MDYIITESRLVKIIDNYIGQTVGNLEMKNSTNIRGTKDDFELVDKNGNIIFEFVAGHLGVSQRLFFTIKNLFNLNDSETENMFVRWFEKKFPNEKIKDSYYSIYY